MPVTKGYKALLAEANAMVEAISPEAAASELGSTGIVFVDLRDPRELDREGRIPGARCCPRGMLEFWIDPDSPYHKEFFATADRLVFFCGGGWRTALAARTAQEMGLGNVVHMEGGFGAWKKAGLPVEAGGPVA